MSQYRSTRREEQLFKEIAQLKIATREKDKLITNWQRAASLADEKLLKLNQETKIKIEMLEEDVHGWKQQLTSQVKISKELQQENQRQQQKIQELTKEVMWRKSNIKALEGAVQRNHQMRLDSQTIFDKRNSEASELITKLQVENRKLMDECKQDKDRDDIEYQQLKSTMESKDRVILDLQDTLREFQEKIIRLEELAGLSYRPILFGNHTPTTNFYPALQQNPMMQYLQSNGSQRKVARIEPFTEKESTEGNWPFTSEDEAAFWQNWQ